MFDMFLSETNLKTKKGEIEMGFAEFKKAQKNQNEQAFIEESELTAKSFKDDRFWMFTKQNGNAKAIVRFLPQKDSAKSPYVKTFKHSFQNPETNRWFIEDCPWTIKTPCPVCKYASETYDEYKKLPSKYRPSKDTWFITNILVIKDELCPENEGKVFLYKFGKEIFKKIESAVKGDEDDEILPIKVFNMFEGHNFRFNVNEKEVNGFSKPVNDYDKCRFEANPCPISEDEDEMEKVYNQIYDLSEFIDPEKFKSETELKEKLANFLVTEKKSILNELKEQKQIENKKETIKEIKETDDSEDEDDFFSQLDEDGDEIPF